MYVCMHLCVCMYVCVCMSRFSPDTLIGGCYNGLLCFFDTRKVVGEMGGGEGRYMYGAVADGLWIDSITVFITILSFCPNNVVICQ